MKLSRKKDQENAPGGICDAQDTPIEPGYNILTLKLFYAISRSQASTAEPDP